MTGQNIICFAKDWSETPTSNNHVMLELSKRNRVLWLNSISTRAPQLASGRDVKKIFRKIGGFLRGVRSVGNSLWVYTPIVLPFPHSPIARKINAFILRMTLRLLRRKLQMREFQLWTFLPNAADYVGSLDESLVVYYCVDEWSKFEYVNGKRIAEAEKKLLANADIVFATAQSLVDDRRPLNPETYLARHGVDHALFATALSPQTVVPDDIAAISKPILGFYGTLQNWVDFDLIEYLAVQHPEWSLVLIGEPAADVSRLRALPNIYFLGRKQHSELPNYCKAFSVGLIPYVLNERIRHVNPLKLREYLSAGLPVVSVALPEVEGYADHCFIARTYPEFENAIEKAIREDSPAKRMIRSDSMKMETWHSRVAELSGRIMELKGKK